MLCHKRLISAEDQPLATIWTSGVAGDLCATLSERGAADVTHDTLCDYRSMRPVKVRMQSLDSYTRENDIWRIDVLKVAVQGAEALVFEGMHTLLRSWRVGILLFEFSSRWLEINPDLAVSLKSTVADLESFGMTSFLFTRPGPIPISSSCWRDMYEDLSISRVIFAISKQLPPDVLHKLRTWIWREG